VNSGGTEMTKSVGFASEIRPLFRQVDIDHMGALRGASRPV
jgi:hypothetical protein